MSEEIATKYERLHSGAMHDLNLAALADYPGPRPESPAAEMLTESSRIALSTQAIATETMACAAFFGAFADLPQHVAQASEDAKTAYDLAISCQQYSCLVADKFADLTRKLRFACLNSDVAFIASINEYRNDVKQMDEWHDLAAAKSKRRPFQSGAPSS